MVRLLSLFLLFNTLNPAWSDDEADEAKCAEDVLAILVANNKINSEICIGGLDDLPQLNIGMGGPLASGESSGQLSKVSMDNIKYLTTLFKARDGKVTFAGYADGEKIPDGVDLAKKMDEEFAKRSKMDFATKKEFLSRMKIVLGADVDTYKYVEELVKDRSEKDPISYTAEEVDMKQVRSVVRNHFLGLTRGKTVCEGIGETGCTTYGFASPVLEANGNLTCANRKRAILQVNGDSFKVKKRTPPVDGKFKPAFSLPDEASEKRDLQLAAGLDVMGNLHALQSANSSMSENFNFSTSDVEVLINKCNPASYQNLKDNLLREFTQIKEKLSELPGEAKFKSDLVKGNYQGIKKELEVLVKKENRSPSENLKMEIIDIVMRGGKHPEGNDLVVARYDQSSNKAVVLNKQLTKKDKKFNWGDDKVFTRNVQCWYENMAEYCSINGKIYKTPPSGVIGHNDMIRVNNLPYVMVDKDFPNASTSPGTEILNCFSPMAAVHEQMQKDKTNSMFVCGSELTDANGKIKLELPDAPVGNRGKGWYCTACGSGIHLTDDNRTYYTDRDSSGVGEFTTLTDKLRNRPVVGTGLNVESMKTLSLFRINRSTVNDRCKEGESTADCIKRLSPDEMDKLLKRKDVTQHSLFKKPSEDVLNMSKDDCFFVPKVMHSCQVSPTGRSQDQRERGMGAKEGACRIKSKLLADTSLKQPTSVDQSKMKRAICEKNLPTSDESQDCAAALKNSDATSKGGNIKVKKE